MVMRPASAAVAGEVRALAQRSSDAAKEIGVLIRAMVDGILQGADCMSQTGKTIDETVQAIERAGAQIGGIASAAHEQSTGTGQVNQAVGQLDSATQQNAALAEQSAAAARVLSDGSVSLERSASVFRP